MQVYLALSRLLAGDGLAPLQALAEAEADLAALAPDAAKARVGPPLLLQCQCCLVRRRKPQSGAHVSCGAAHVRCLRARQVQGGTRPMAWQKCAYSNIYIYIYNICLKHMHIRMSLCI